MGISPIKSIQENTIWTKSNEDAELMGLIPWICQTQIWDTVSQERLNYVQFDLEYISSNMLSVQPHFSGANQIDLLTWVCISSINSAIVILENRLL